MRLLVCGGRDFADRVLLRYLLDALLDVHHVSKLIHGAERGADRLAEEWARDRNIKIMPFPADWTTHGKAAGPIRNARMLDEAHPDLAVAFPGGRGTADMVKRAHKAGVRVIIVEEQV